MQMAEVKYKKETEYRDSEDNYVLDGEITITITLNEYRKLVEFHAAGESKIAAAEKDKRSRNEENEKLKKEVSRLKSELYELTKKDRDNDGIEPEKEDEE